MDKNIWLVFSQKKGGLVVVRGIKQKSLFQYPTQEKSTKSVGVGNGR